MTKNLGYKLYDRKSTNKQLKCTAGTRALPTPFPSPFPTTHRKPAKPSLQPATFQGTCGECTQAAIRLVLNVINKNDAMHLHGVNLCLGTQIRVQKHTPPPRYISPLRGPGTPLGGHRREVLSILSMNVSISRHF